MCNYPYEFGGLLFCVNRHILLTFEYTSSDGSGKTAQICSFTEPLLIAYVISSQILLIRTPGE